MSKTVPNSENKLCDNDHTPDAMREFERYCETHSNNDAKTCVAPPYLGVLTAFGDLANALLVRAKFS